MCTPEMDNKVYRAVITYDSAGQLFYGDVLALSDIIAFDGRSVDELNVNFHAVVAAFLESCRADGEEPNRPESGKIQ